MNNNINTQYATSASPEVGHLQNTGTSNPRRTRITRACDTCRRKKIKCDVDSKHPCTTCRQYDWECTFHDTAKKRGPPKGYIESLETRLEKMEKLLRNIGDDDDADALSLPSKRRRRNSSQDPHEQQEETEPYQHSVTIQTTPVQIQRHELNSQTAKAKVVRYHGSSSGYYLVGNILSNEENAEKTNAANNDPASQIIPQQQQQQQEVEEGTEEKQKVIVVYNGRESYRLRRMNLNDNDLMVFRDATADEEAIQMAVDEQESIDDIVPRPVVEALVHTYFNDAHTTLPVIEKDEYLDAFNGTVLPPPAPLLTYAICTYACFLLKSDDPIFKNNDVERDEIFQVLLDRASMLVRKEYLKPRIVTIQALILMCGHPTYSTSSYRNWILAGMAVRMAQDLGLHRTLATVEASGEYKERRKRLWYSAYCTDRWCCAVMGRPLAIADSDCDVDLPLVNGPDQNEDLTMFVNFVKLSGILGEVLRRIYSPKAKLNGYKTKAMEQTVWSLQRMLEEWFANVPDGYKITEYDLLDMRLNPQLYQGTKKVTEGGPMTVCYHAVVLLLHRPFIVLEKDDHDIPSLSRATELCTQAAKLAVDVARAIPYMSIAKFGWNFAAYSVFQAALIHVYNCTSKDPTTAKQAKDYLDICTNECLAPLSKDIPAGPPLIPFLQTLSTLLKNDNNGGENTATEDKDTVPREQSNEGGQQYQQQQRQNFQAPQQQAPPLITPMMTSNGYVEQPDNAMPKLDNGSWLLNGGNGNPALSQAAWQQLFSTAGTPFSAGDNLNRGYDVQGWDSFFMDNQSADNTNMFM